MESPQKTPSRQIWLEDFRAVLELPRVSVDEVRKTIFERHPDFGYADEYGRTIWSAYCFFLKHRDYWEERRLIVQGAKSILFKEGLFVALYAPFLTCTLKDMDELKFDHVAIADEALRIEEKYGGK